MAENLRVPEGANNGTAIAVLYKLQKSHARRVVAFLCLYIVVGVAVATLVLPTAVPAEHYPWYLLGLFILTGTECTATWKVLDTIHMYRSQTFRFAMLLALNEDLHDLFEEYDQELAKDTERYFRRKE